MISVRDAVKRFQVGAETITAVDAVTLDVAAGCFACVYGASGSGKSTLLNLIGGLDVADAGSITVGGFEMTHTSERARANIRLQAVGVVFQDHNLIAEFTAGENVFLPLLARGVPRATAVEEASAALGLVGIRELFHRRPLEMSGGQRQRVGIARALVGGRRVLLADEPTGALDSENSRTLFRMIAGLCHDLGAAAVIATHDPLASEFADTVLTMRDGRLTA